MYKKVNIYKAILMIYFILLLVFDISPGVKFAIAFSTIACLILNRKKLLFFNKFTILLIPILSGFIFGLNADAGFNIIKDIFYLVSPMVFLLMGVALYKKVSLKFIIQIVVIFGVLLTFKKILVNFQYAGLSGLINPFIARYGSGFRGDPTPAIASGLLLTALSFNIKLYSARITKILLLINLYGFYLMASRVYLVVLICFCLMILVHKFRQHLGAIAIMGIVSFTVMFFFLSSMEAGSYESDGFAGKLMNSVNEISASNFRTDEDINLKYRGYESFMAWKTFLSGSIGEKLFGELGKLIDLKVFITSLSEKPLRFIPILHNGYLYLLIKTGVLGICIYIFYFVRLFIYGLKVYLKSNDKLLKFMTGIFLSSIIGLLISNLVISSFFYGEMILLQLLIGYIFVVLKMYNKETASLKQDITYE